MLKVETDETFKWNWEKWFCYFRMFKCGKWLQNSFFFTVNCFAEQCGQEELAKCASSLEKLQSSSDLSIAKSKEELDILCP